jgi:hypothetical protein
LKKVIKEAEKEELENDSSGDEHVEDMVHYLGASYGLRTLAVPALAIPTPAAPTPATPTPAAPTPATPTPAIKAPVIPTLAFPTPDIPTSAILKKGTPLGTDEGHGFCAAGWLCFFPTQALNAGCFFNEGKSRHHQCRSCKKPMHSPLCGEGETTELECNACADVQS